MSDARDIPKALARGAARALAQLGFTSLVEVPLADGRRADLMALGPDGALVIVEVKSSVADFRADRKWHEYRAWCDRLYFAVPEGFPLDLIPLECGLMRADGFGAAVLREPQEHKLVPARRRAIHLRYARLAASRLTRINDPGAFGAETGI
jgi:hypothetical protein